MDIEVRNYDPFAVMEIGFQHGLGRTNDVKHFSIENIFQRSSIKLYVESTETLKDLAFEILKAVAQAEAEVIS
jgi:hypothetical protein